MNVMETIQAALSGYWVPQEIAANIAIFFNILGALFLGLIVGYERSYHGRAAGMRTYGLVSMASCALVVLTGYPEHWYGGHGPTLINAVDPGRVIQGVCTGVGFLGAGVIMRDGFNISGLTTAASIWSVSAIGTLVGVGFYGSATGLALLSGGLMMWGGNLEKLLPQRHAIALTLRFRDHFTISEEDVSRMMTELGYEVARGSFSITEHGNKPEWRFVATSRGQGQAVSLIALGRVLSASKDVETYTLTHARN